MSIQLRALLAGCLLATATVTQVGLTNAPPRISPVCLPAGAGPDTIVAALVDAVNDGTYAAINSVVSRYWNVQRFPSAALADIKQQFGRWHWLSAKLGDRHVCATSPTSAYANAVNAITGETDSLSIALNPQTGKVFQWGIRAGAQVPITPADTSSDEARARALASFVHSLAEGGAFSGEILFAHGGRVLYHEAAGVANRTTGERARKGQQYSIASVGKLITATAVMRLVEQGRLSLDDTIGKFLAARERPAAAGGVALKHILSHTDGMTRGVDTLASKPGTQFSYVNYGYYLLGVIIERVTGKPFIDCFRTEVFAPAGMTHTSLLELKELDPVLPPAYAFAFDSTGPNFVVNREAQLTRGTGAGGLFSTVDDLYRFVEALRSGRIVSKTTLDLMREPKRALGASDYGYGVDWYLGDNIWGHIGHIPGADAEIDLFGDSGYTLIVLSNSEPNDIIRRRVTALVGRRPVCRSLAENACTPRPQ